MGIDGGIRFLSTPPSRVATRSVSLFATIFVFLSTPPSRVATRGPRRSGKRTDVSIHATLAGGDCSRIASGSPNKVSIHATLAGGDVKRTAIAQGKGSFYPRHPRGWRQADAAHAMHTDEVSIHATLAGGDRAESVRPAG